MQNKIYTKAAVTIVVAFIMTFILLMDVNAQFQILDYDLKCPGGSSGQDYGRAIINRFDKGYAIAGYTYQSPACIGSFDWFLLKLKENGMTDCSDFVGLTRDDKCYSLVQMSDSGYNLAGYFTNNVPPYRKRATWVRYNKNCTPVNARAVFDSLNSSYYQLVRDPSFTTGYTGYIETYITAGMKRNKILAAQYSPAGVPLWVSRYNSGGLSTEEAFSLCFQPINGTYGLAARTNYFSGISGVYDIMIVKLNYGGAVIWKKVYRILLPAATFYPNTEPRKIIAMPDGGFTVVGFTNAYGSTQRDVVVLRVSSTGAVMWYHTYGSSGLYEQGESITLDGANLVITGSERTVAPVGSPNVLTMKIPVGGGAPVWTKRWDSANPTDIGYDIVTSTTGATNGYAITGHTYRGADLNNAFLDRVNVDGIVPIGICNSSINSPWVVNACKVDSFQIIRQNVNEITSPFTHVAPVVELDTLCSSLLAGPFEGKKDNEDNIEVRDPESEQQLNESESIEHKETESNAGVNEFKLLQNSPNPFNPTTTIYFEIPSPGYTKLSVYDVSGRLVSELLNDFKEPGRHQVQFDGSNLSSGIYYYKIESQNFIAVKKMILIK